jgi:hypothetical protein
MGRSGLRSDGDLATHQARQLQVAGGFELLVLALEV